MSDGKTSGIEPELYEKLVKEWDYEKNARTRFEDYQRYLSLDAWWRCDKGHSYKATIEDRIKGTGCRFCERNKAKHSITPPVSMKPQLVREWDYEKNDKRPEDYLLSGSEVVWWKCQYGHSWQASIYSRLRKPDCPKCSRSGLLMGRNIVNLYPELLMEWDYEKNDRPPEVYAIYSDEKVWWKCDKGHSWQTKISTRIRGSGCPVCNRRRVERGVNDLPTRNPELVKEWDYEKNECSPEEYSFGSNEKVWWKCEKGHSWQAVIYNRFKGAGCPYCSSSRKVNKVNFATVNPELVREWDYEKNEHGPEEYAPQSGKKVWWKCEKGHSWQAVIYNRSNGTGCPYCSGRCAIIGKTDFATLNPELVREWDYEKNEHGPEEYAPHSGKMVWWKCEKGHSWQTTVDDRSRGHGCPYCARSRMRKNL